jgi:hypothetical protein
MNQSAFWLDPESIPALPDVSDYPVCSLSSSDTGSTYYVLHPKDDTAG